MTVSARDRSTTIAASIAAAIMIAQQIAGKATRDALFLSNFDAAELPKAMIAAAALSVISVLLVSRAMARFGPARIVPAAFLLSGSLFLVEWFFNPTSPGMTAWAVYLHMAVFGSIVISGFWSLVNERFDPHVAKKQIARIATGATFGGIVGGVSAERVAALMDVRTMLMVLAVLNAVCAFAVLRVGGPPVAHPSRDTEVRSGLRLLAEVSYLRTLALLVTVVASAAALIDYAFKAEAAQRLESGEALMQFFALFYMATSVLTFLVQSSLAKKSLAKLGLDGTIAVLPATVLLLSVLGAAATRLWTATLLRGAEQILANSLFRSGYELLYTPMAPKQKRPTKTIIDVGFERLGDALGSGLVLLVLFVAPGSGGSAPIALGAVAAGLALWASRRLHHDYVGALAESLRTGVVHLEEGDVVDATTRRTLTETTMALDREKLLQQIRLLRQKQGKTSSQPPPTEESELVLSAPPPPTSDASSLRNPELAEKVRILLTGTDAEEAEVLDGGVDPHLATHIVPLLSHPHLNKKAISALQAVAPRVVGLLVDALVDPSEPFSVRRRIPRVLRVCESRRAAEGLFEGLSDDRFEVRYQCGQALAHMQRSVPSTFQFSKERVFDAVMRELDVGAKVWESQRQTEGEPDQESPWLDEVLTRRLHRNVEHVFTVLSLALDPEPLSLSLRALNGEDPALRGTALEYLENVLPDRIRERLWPYIGQERAPKPKVNRSREQIVDDLLSSMDSLQIDRAALRKENP